MQRRTHRNQVGRARGKEVCADHRPSELEEERPSTSSGKTARQQEKGRAEEGLISTLTAERQLRVLARDVDGCERCPRLRDYCREIAQVKRRAYLDWEYWSKPVPAFGRFDARVLVIGLAPGAHGANRTGRMFTGDKSGDFLYRALFDTGFASQPASNSRDDGLLLKGMYITAAARCAPPGNRPSKEEFANCRPFLERELDLLTEVRVVVALGALALEAYLAIQKARGKIASRSAFRFAHGAEFQVTARRADGAERDFAGM